MSRLRQAIPASYRVPVESSRFAQGLVSRAKSPGPISTSITAFDSRFTGLMKARFNRLPQEPDDARMTGVTRSLHRRLLALNLKGSRLQGKPLFASNVA
jgi:hypothetical protein